MRLKPLLLAAAVVLAGAASAAPAAPAPARAAVDWSRTVVATPEGGLRMGNPAAQVKLVEYGSLTCGHCANFSAEAKAPLAAAIRSGKVSFEFRNFVLNGLDAAASLVARCAPPARFFGLADEMFATQEAWTGRVAGLSDAEKDRLNKLPEGRRLAAVAEKAGLLALAARHGLPAAQARRCISDPAGLARLDRIGEAAEALGVQGTPTFLLNGAMLGVNTWPEIESLIRQAGG